MQLAHNEQRIFHWSNLKISGRDLRTQTFQFPFSQFPHSHNPACRGDRNSLNSTGKRNFWQLPSRMPHHTDQIIFQFSGIVLSAHGTPRADRQFQCAGSECLNVNDQKGRDGREFEGNRPSISSRLKGRLRGLRGPHVNHMNLIGGGMNALYLFE